MEELEQKIRKVKEGDIERGLLVPKKGKGHEYKLPVSGKDILDTFEHIKQGPMLGEIIRRLKEKVLMGKLDDYDEKQRAEKAKEIIRELAGNEKQVAMLETWMKRREKELKEQKEKDIEEGRPPKAPPFTEVSK